MSRDGSSREHLLDEAEKLFAHKGYAATTLRDISSKLGISHAALYYHFPDGKDSLFEAVTERAIRKHGSGLRRFMEEGGPHLRDQLLGAAAWFLSQPPMDLLRMSETDMPALPDEVSGRLMRLMHAEMLVPLTEAFAGAALRGETVVQYDPGLLAATFMGIIQNLHATPGVYVKRSRPDMARELIDVVLRGIGYMETGGV